MAENLTERTHGLPNSFIRLSKFLWKKQKTFWSVILLNVVLNILSTLLSTKLPWSIEGTPLAWIIQNLSTGLFYTLIVLLLIYIIIFLGSRFEIGTPVKTVSDKDLRQRYLLHMIGKHKNLILTDIPAALFATQSVPLDEVFIPLQLLPKRFEHPVPFMEENFDHYRELLKKDLFPEEIQRVYFDPKIEWEKKLKNDNKISIAELWRQLTRDHPTAVIQGYPGMGKSTIMARLTLHVARRGLNKSDPHMEKSLVDSPASSPVPILFLLKEYATRLAKAHANLEDLSSLDYLKIVVNQSFPPGLSLDMFAFLRRCLESGQCLVIFDGLDEVSDPSIRKQIQEEISTFVSNYSSIPGPSFNRFLITSRVAGYDIMAFPTYTYHTIANLTPEQIAAFLPRWFHVSIRHEPSSDRDGGARVDEFLTKESDRLARRLNTAIRNQQGVNKLVENPLLLTLLAVMVQQYNLDLSRQRIDLYAATAKILLENRNLSKELKPIYEAQAIERLGPIAFKMQQAGSDFVSERDLMESLKKIISREEGTSDEIAQEAKNFLARVSERAGFFGQRADDYFGFSHTAFQEYFVARYLLNLIKQAPTKWIVQLVKWVRSSDDLWREPFLLAVAYQSGQDEVIARKIITALLATPLGADFASRTHDLLLAAECLVEAKPFTIGAQLETQIVQLLLQTYEEAQRIRRFHICREIEGVLTRWLLSLPSEAYQPALLMNLVKAISDEENVALQCATLTLLSMIAQELVDCPPIVFEALVPPLLALTGLPAIGEYEPAANLSVVSNLNVADLALTALSFFGKRGPAGLLLKEVRQHFKKHPGQLNLLARCSVESGTLLTLTVVPLEAENYSHYEFAIREWITLRDQHKIGDITEREIERCRAIHQKLLDSAEEVCYPSHAHLLEMLQTSAHLPNRSWQQIQLVWQNYLLNQLRSGQYLNYQQAILLWVSLFPSEPVEKPLTSLLLKHYSSDDKPVQRYVQRFLALASNDLRDIRDQDLLEHLRNLSYLSYLNNLSAVRYLRYTLHLNFMRYLSSLDSLSSLRDIVSLLYLRYHSSLSSLQDLRSVLLTQETVEKAKHLLPASDLTEYIDLLTILLGRLLQILQKDEKGIVVEQEIQQIAQVALTELVSTNSDEVSAAALDILSYLLTRSGNEVNYVLQLAEAAEDERVHRACALAIKYSSLETDEAWIVLETGRRSKVAEIRMAVEERLRRGNRSPTISGSQ